MRQLFITAVYEIRAWNRKQAAKEIIYGQSIGNPYIRTPYDKALKQYLPEYEIKGSRITVRYPLANIDFIETLGGGKTINVNHLMSMLMGGQMDIDNIRSCRLVELDFGKASAYFRGPRYGIKGIRHRLKVYGRPLIGAIIKPKIGIGPEKVADIVEEMIDGGVDFIKEDEILANQRFCPMEDRLKAVKERIGDRPVIYAACITADGGEISYRYNMCTQHEIPAVHLNIWSSLGAYANLRNIQSDAFQGRWPALFFQKSGDKIWTTGKFSIEFTVLCKLANLIGCDFMHVGMFGGYMADKLGELRQRIAALKTTIPSFSCGATPEIAKRIRGYFGSDVMIAAGGYVAGHPKGVGYAVREFREAIS